MAGTDVDVVVVGAGFAGLVTARSLLRAARPVLVLEARDRVGGRVVNHVFDDGATVELGGQWVGPTQDRVLGLCREYGLDTFPTYDTGQYVVERAGRLTRFRGDTFGFPPHVLVDALVTQRRLERMARTIPVSAPWSAARAARWDGETLESWLRRNTRFELTRHFFRLLTASIFCAEASELSLLHFLFYARSGGSLGRLMATRDGAQDSRVVGGTARIAEAIAAELGVRIRTSSPVHAITQHAGAVTVRHAEGEVRAERVVVTLPPHLAGRISYDPALPPARDQLTQSVPMGAVVKCIARYERPFWRDTGLAGFGASMDRPVNMAFDNSPPDGATGMLVGFFDGDHARAASRLDPDARRRVVLDTFAAMFGEQARTPIGYAEKDWSADPWSGGCYGGHLAPGTWTRLGPALREPCGRIHWAGTETSDVWNGYIEGAVRSGERAATEVLAALPPG